jgi:hypothetical protein
MSRANEKWKELCEQVIAERDPTRLTELVATLNDSNCSAMGSAARTSGPPS